MPVNNDPKETDMVGMVTIFTTIGTVIATVVGTITSIFAKFSEAKVLRENNGALREAGNKSYDALE